ncbi:MAG: hypothetical protein A2381_05340 [Bdellovibrionales bacterium RIFOXYB1_FULL_37_110]|nr:MAG: hypothetical protein A2417_16820 [Bdellovibrionales bacterium RIFOXYC1_FULL_37_79]OFZ58170.1 MAG: hypothetical protein A2381_05340 [Bdellovibrionales bacterium RIFOXYB1_FULL_37_110]OFZ61859.1 MAG: hypothetical protein A2577_18925 [Bdellovibrionales bacterium RIFOXYD1_FULL_36_51]
MKITLLVTSLYLALTSLALADLNETGGSSQSIPVVTHETSQDEDSLKRTGYDINGELRSCYAMDTEQLCTVQYTKGEEFALKCAKSGGIPFQCDCHDYICLSEVE